MIDTEMIDTLTQALSDSPSNEYYCNLIEASAVLWVECMRRAVFASQGIEYSDAAFDEIVTSAADTPSEFQRCSQATSDDVANVCACQSIHPQGHLCWEVQKDFYLARARITTDKNKHVEALRSAFIQRLKTPHNAIDATFTDYSSFETEFDNSNYMARMTSANKIVSATKGLLAPLSPFETNLVHSIFLTNSRKTTPRSMHSWPTWTLNCRARNQMHSG